ncbi:unnamed protein product [Ectocarpus sp. CCAP 1310/34]|nr:unnamed protein product [Ectocarpus sp. CCAP 1310/34]
MDILGSGDIEAATKNSLLSLGGNGGGGGSSSAGTVDVTNKGEGGGADGTRRPVIASGAGRTKAGSESTLETWQLELIERVKVAMDDPSFSCSQRVKFEEICEGAAEPMGMAGATPEDVLKVACSKYTLGRTLALDAMRERELSLSQLQKSGVERLNLGSPFKEKTNYATVYVFSDRAAANRMVDMWANVIGIGAQLCGAYRKKINEHDFGDRRFLRLMISGEGGWQSAAKYGTGLINPPTEERAKKPRQKYGRVANDGPAWLVPAGLVLAGGGALKTVTWET